MLWRASKNKYQKDVCCEEIRLHAHNEMIVVSSVWVNVTWMKGGGVYMTTLISTRISIVMMNAIALSLVITSAMVRRRLLGVGHVMY